LRARTQNVILLKRDRVCRRRHAKTKETRRYGADENRSVLEKNRTEPVKNRGAEKKYLCFIFTDIFFDARPLFLNIGLAATLSGLFVDGGRLYLLAVVKRGARCCRIGVGEATGEVLPGSRAFIYPRGKFQNRGKRGEEGSRNIDLGSGCGRKARLRQEKAGLLRQISRREGGER
jgi:hypothetical protein